MVAVFQYINYSRDCNFIFSAKLSREAVIEGILHWKMHYLQLRSLFFLPWGYWLNLTLIRTAALLGLSIYVLLAVQSSIAFTSVAKGNVAGVVHLSQTWWVCLSRQF